METDPEFQQRKLELDRGIRNKTFLKLWPNPFLQDGIPLSRNIKNVYFPCQVYDFNGWPR